MSRNHSQPYGREPIVEDMPAAPMPTASPSAVRAYYLRKNAEILHRYGPGPQVHFHAAVMAGGPPHDGTPAELRRRIVEGQTRYLDRCADIWEAATVFRGRVLDIGCGLGGPAIYWAQRFGVEVTGLTIEPAQAQLAAQLADDAGMGHLVSTTVEDFTVAHPQGKFGTAVSNEAFVHMDRYAAFANASRTLPIGAYLCIEDVLLSKPEGKAPADRYWSIDIGPLAEYIAAAQASGFTLDRNVDVTAEGADYWLWSIAWADSQLAQLESEDALTEATESRLLRSIREHARMYRCITNNVYEFRALRFHKVRDLASDRS